MSGNGQNFKEPLKSIVKIQVFTDIYHLKLTLLIIGCINQEKKRA